MIHYRLEKKLKKRASITTIVGDFLPYVKGDRYKLFGAFVAILINSIVNVAAPYVLGRAVDEYIVKKDIDGLLSAVLILIALYTVSFVTNYYQIILMGKAGQGVLYRLRHSLFRKLQSLPIAFFSQNKSGDLISRITTDTESIQQMFTEVLVRMTGTIFTLIGVGVFIVVLNPKMGLLTLAVAAVALLITNILGPYTRKVNKKSSDDAGEYSAEVQENLSNFKAVLAAGKRNYFYTKLHEYNEKSSDSYMKAKIVTAFAIPLYNFAGQFAQIAIVLFGFSLIMSGEVTIGLLISFIAYADRFFEPLRIMASLWNQVQSSMAAWARVKEIFNLESHLVHEKGDGHFDSKNPNCGVLDFENVSFMYEDGEDVILKDVSFSLCRGETLALVGPTGGGKSTIAKLMIRLHDPASGHVYLDGRDIRSYHPQEISKRIGFILQDTILFTGSLGENLVYGHYDFDIYQKDKLEKMLKERHLDELMDLFDDGLDTQVSPESSDISLGQRQIISFMRAVLRDPEILILDEATANVDTVTEGKLQKILDGLNDKIALVIIAHRLNTIKSADSIIFVSPHRIESAISFDEALKLISDEKADR